MFTPNEMVDVFTGGAAPAAVAAGMELANTTPTINGADGLTSLTDARRFLVAHHMETGQPVVPADLDKLRALRDDLLALLASRDLVVAADTLNRLAEVSGAHPFMHQHSEGVWGVDWQVAEVCPSRYVMAQVSVGIMEFLTRYGFDRIQTCAGRDCGRYFADFSKNGSKKFCDGRGCAGKTHTAAYRKRQHATAKASTIPQP